MLSDTPLATYWYLAASSGYASPDDWMGWADRLLLKESQIPVWIIDLGAARSESDLQTVLRPQLVEEGLLLTSDVEGNVLLGYVLKLLQEGRLTVEHALKEMGEIADSCHAKYEPEYFYTLLSDTESLLKTPRTVIVELRYKLKGCLAEADRQWVLLQNI